MTKPEVLNIVKEKGNSDAIELRRKSAAGEYTDTEIIDREQMIPYWSHEKDYTNVPAGAPVSDEGQVWTLIQPHNASYYDGRPSTLRALWGLKHTKNPQKAKPYVQPLGTSGMYMKGECCTDNQADPDAVYIAKNDNTVYAPHEYSEAWYTYEG